ncbi:MAG: amino acid ABC transporter substrate-binding protein [Anaerolineales bacterium]|jgi:branched-chain amino acid transport system substrate-binding protein|nr:amino acid ABC transporter substrate-binding protein [Anaerolineales bacterium]
MQPECRFFKIILLLASLLFQGCSAAGQVQPTLQPGETQVVIGFTISQTGNLNVESTRQMNGLNLWMKQVNEAGGVRLKDGSLVKFSAVYYDDESTKDRVQQLYTRLATRDKAAFFISPYSSGLADAAAVVAEQYSRIMITTGAASDSTYKRGFTLVYQVYTPSSRYLSGAVDLLRATDPSAQKIAIIHENDKFSTDVSKAIQQVALERGYQVVFFEGYDTGTTDFAPFINKIEQTDPDVILGGGHFQDGSTFARQLYEKKIDVKMVVLLVAPPEENFSEIGAAALGIIGPSQWEEQVNFSVESAANSGRPFFGPSNQEFVQSYQAMYQENPSYHAAGGYAAGLILQYAIELSGSVETQAVKSVLDQMDIYTFFGQIKFQSAADQHGLQTGHSMVYVQWQAAPAGELEKQVVWPPEGSTAKVVYPIR